MGLAREGAGERIVRRTGGVLLKPGGGQVLRRRHAGTHRPVHAGIGVISQSGGEAGGEGRGRADHRAHTCLAELAFGMVRVEIQHRRMVAAAAMMDHAFAAEPHQQVRTSDQRVQPPVAGQLADEILGGSLPRQPAAERNSLGAQVFGVEHHHEPVRVGTAVGSDRSLPHRIPERAGGQRPRHLDHHPGGMEPGQQAAPARRVVAKAIAGIVEHQDRGGAWRIALEHRHDAGAVLRPAEAAQAGDAKRSGAVAGQSLEVHQGLHDFVGIILLDPLGVRADDGSRSGMAQHVGQQQRAATPHDHPRAGMHAPICDRTRRVGRSRHRPREPVTADVARDNNRIVGRRRCHRVTPPAIGTNHARPSQPVAHRISTPGLPCREGCGRRLLTRKQAWPPHGRADWRAVTTRACRFTVPPPWHMMRPEGRLMRRAATTIRQSQRPRAWSAA